MVLCISFQVQESLTSSILAIPSVSQDFLPDGNIAWSLLVSFVGFLIFFFFGCVLFGLGASIFVGFFLRGVKNKLCLQKHESGWQWKQFAGLFAYQQPESAPVLGFLLLLQVFRSDFCSDSHPRLVIMKQP